MKKMLFATALLALVAACGPKHEGYTITGTIDGAPNGQVVLTNSSRTAPFTDTATLTDGKFEFTGKVTTPEIYVLRFADGQMLNLLLDNSIIKIAGSVDSIAKATVKGSKLDKAMRDLKAQKQKIEDDFDAVHHTRALIEEYYDGATNEERKAEILQFFENLLPEQQIKNQQIRTLDSLYMAKHPTSPYTVVMVREKASDMAFPELAAHVERFTNAVALADNYIVSELQKTVAVLEKVQVGQKAPDFTQEDPNGKPVTFSDVYAKNKVTMIDFWASWCGPCRRFNPELVKIYDQYKALGLEIVATSLDGEKERWVKAIKDDKLTWVHMSDLKRWDNEVAKLYGVRYIPQNVFVDQDGIILASKLDEKDIEPFLEAHLK